MTSDSIYEDAQRGAGRIVQSLRPSEHDEAIVQAGEEDQAKGFCGPSLNSANFVLLTMLADGGQSALTQAFNLACVFSFYGKPPPHLRAGRSSCGQAFGLVVKTSPTPIDAFQCGRTTAIWPSRRTMTATLEPHVFDVTMDRCSGSPTPCVPSTGSLASFRQPAVDCPTARPCSLHFDDLTIQHFGIMGGAGQAFVNELATCFGSPFQAEKHQSLAAQSDAVAGCHQGAPVKFWARDRLVTKVTDIMAEAAQTQRFPAGLAAKLFGCLGFLGKLGRSGLHSIKERQCSSQAQMTDELYQSFS